MIEAFRKYKELGYSCLPTKEDKSPDCRDTWNKVFNESDFEHCYGIGLMCGKVSGGVECLDFDNHQGDAIENLKKFMSIPEVSDVYKRNNLPIEKTKGGGYHVLYRCATIDGNRKLAQRWIEELKRPDAFIETKGEGGYVCIDPTPGYKIIKNDISNIPLISIEDRITLIDSASSMNQYSKAIATEYEKGERAGDIYNGTYEAIQDMKSLLQSAGWSERGNMWIRPGKSKGISASLGVVAPNVFYVFTQNGHPFEGGRAYTPFQVLALLKFNGDFTEAVKSLPQKEQPKEFKKKEITETELERILKGTRIDTTKQIELPPTILSIMDDNCGQFIQKRLFTLGNFSVIIGKAKSKKTFLLTMLTSALLKESQKFVSGLAVMDKKTILWFDTEQGEYDSYNSIRRIERLAGRHGGLQAFNLRPFSPIERCQIIEYAFKVYGKDTAYCVIDGIADLANGINDEDEATRVSTILLRLTKVYNCHMSIVIHQNKNDNFATGHLGSALMKKAEIIISVAKNNSDKRLADVNCDLSRGIDFEPFSFTITDEGLPEIYDAIKPTARHYYQRDEDVKEEIPF